MLDFLCIALGIAFFALAALFVRGIERLEQSEEETP